LPFGTVAAAQQRGQAVVTDSRCNRQLHQGNDPSLPAGAPRARRNEGRADGFSPDTVFFESCHDDISLFLGQLQNR
jgi:hypothetical protein